MNKCVHDSVCLCAYVCVSVNKTQEIPHTPPVYSLWLFLAIGHVKVHTTIHPEWAAVAFNVLV